MKKLSLRIDEVRVSSFEVAAVPAVGKGTVQGADALTRYTYCDQDTCFASCRISDCPAEC